MTVKLCCHLKSTTFNNMKIINLHDNKIENQLCAQCFIHCVGGYVYFNVLGTGKGCEGIKFYYNNFSRYQTLV